MSPENRERLRKKIKYYDFANEIGGCITPAEFVYMIEKFSIDNDPWESYVRSKMKKGETRPSWYYFDLDENAIDRI